MKFIRKTAIMAAIVTIGFSACQKENKDSFDATEEDTFAESVESNVSEDADAVAFYSACGRHHDRRHLPECAEVTVDTTAGSAYPKVITIDFGDGCADRSGRIRKGKIIISISDDMANANAQRTVTFENFSVNDRSVEGTRTVTNNGQNDNGNWVFGVESNMTISGPRGSVSRKVTATREWLSGFGTCERGDDVLLIEGSGTTTFPDGKTATRTILEALKIDRSCDYITQGVVELNFNDERKRTIDFGDGTCDNLATVTTAGGRTFEINLDEHRVERRVRRR